MRRGFSPKRVVREITEWAQAIRITYHLFFNKSKGEEDVRKIADSITTNVRDIILDPIMDNISPESRKRALRRIREAREKAGLGLKIVKKSPEGE